MAFRESVKTPSSMLSDRDQGAPLQRELTAVTLSPEQYERLFFAPETRGVSANAKTLANPTLLGIISFLIPYTSTMFILLGWQGAVAPTSLIGLNGDYYFCGGIGMIIAGLAEFVLGNTYPMTVFIVYGTHWCSLAYVQDPWHQTLSGFSELGGATGAAWNSSQGFHNVTMAMVSFIFLIGAVRVNALFVLVFIGLVFLFSFIAAADFSVASATTAADVAHVQYLLKIGGGWGFMGGLCGWYLTIVTVAESVGLPLPLPVFDLSTKVFPKSNKTKASA